MNADTATTSFATGHDPLRAIFAGHVPASRARLFVRVEFAEVEWPDGYALGARAVAWEVGHAEVRTTAWMRMTSDQGEPISIATAAMLCVAELEAKGAK